MFLIKFTLLAHADFQLWRARKALWKVKSDFKWMEIVNCRIRNPNHVKNLNLCLSCALCTRGHVRTGNFEMLKITWFVLKVVKKLFWAFLNFDARARARRDEHADMDCQYVMPWLEMYVYWIWSIYDEWLWRYEWKRENTKWRLADVMVEWSHKMRLFDVFLLMT